MDVTPSLLATVTTPGPSTCPSGPLADAQVSEPHEGTKLGWKEGQGHSGPGVLGGGCDRVRKGNGTSSPGGSEGLLLGSFLGREPHPCRDLGSVSTPAAGGGGSQGKDGSSGDP